MWNRRSVLMIAMVTLALGSGAPAAQVRSNQDSMPPRNTQRPPLHGSHWMAITGKPLGATAGAMMFQQGGNAIDAACAMLGAVSTMWDTLGWGGETQALIYNPKTKKVIGINALGVAPTGATVEYYKSQGYNYPPEFGPLAAITPGTPGGLLVMLKEFGTLSLAQVLAPAIAMADGYAIEAQAADAIERQKDEIKKWKYSPGVFLPHKGETREAPAAGEIFKQADLAATLRKLVEAEAAALKAGKSRADAIQAAYDRFYKGDIAQELVRGFKEDGGLFTADDLAKWQVKIEEPLSTNYKGVDVFKLAQWQQGPALLQALNILENVDVKALGYNTPRYLHTLYQTMNLAFADRDFYYGDPAFPPEEPMRGLLSKEYAAARARLIVPDRNDPAVKPGDPYPFQGSTNPFKQTLDAWPPPDKPVRIGSKGTEGSNVGRRFLCGHDVNSGGRRLRLGDFNHAERGMDSRGDCRTHRDRPQPARAIIRARPGGEPVQRHRAGQASARHAHADARNEGWPAVDGVFRAGRGLAGSEPAAMLPEHPRVRHDAAAGRRSAEHELVSDAQFVSGSHLAAGPHARRVLDA